MVRIEYYFLLFYVYAIIGWMIEVSLGVIQNKKFVNRGFMIGPYCPIYGVGSVLITLCLQQYTQNLFVLFCVAIVICGLLEYATSYIMEKIFKARWWDYSKKRFNINGRVCLETIIPFGLLGCFIMYVSNPFFMWIFNKIPQNILGIICLVLLVFFIADFMVSYFVISRLKNTVKEVNKKQTYDSTEEITKKVKEILRSKSIFDRRLVNAFPKFSIDEVKQRIKDNVIKVKDEATEKIKESAEKVKVNTIKIKDEATDIIKESANKVKETTLKVKDGATEKIKEQATKIKKDTKNEK